MASKGYSQSQMSEETFPVLCTTCAEDNKKVEAIKYCVECCNYCCQSCTDVHKRFPTLKNHNLLEVNQGRQPGSQQPRLLEIPTERCSIHPSKVIDMYCDVHDEVGCSACFVTDHKSCDKGHIHSIPDSIDAIFKPTVCKQTYSQLKDTIVSLHAVSKSKDTKLQNLIKDKNNALSNIDTCEKALVAIVRRVAESSRKEVEFTYKQQETTILEEKQGVTNMSKNLQTTKDKIDGSEENRAQRLVCSKIAETQMKEAASEKIKDKQSNTSVLLSFTPDQSLMDYMKSLQIIGQVKKHQKEKKNSLYKIRSSQDISTNLLIDKESCWLSFGCLTPDGQLLVTDSANKRLKRIDTHNMSVADYCSLDSKLFGICYIGNDEVAVACQSKNKIQFVSIGGNTMTCTRQINMTHKCYGIGYNNGNLHVTDACDSLYVYDMSGTCLTIVTNDNAGNKLFRWNRLISFNESGEKMFVGDVDNGLVCFDRKGNYLSTLTDTDLKYVMGACVDGGGNMFVVGCGSHNVVQFDENGRKVGEVVKSGDRLYRPLSAGDGLKNPVSVSFDQKLNRLYVTMVNSDVMKMYELE